MNIEKVLERDFIGEEQKKNQKYLYCTHSYNNLNYKRCEHFFLDVCLITHMNKAPNDYAVTIKALMK